MDICSQNEEAQRAPVRQQSLTATAVQPKRLEGQHSIRPPGTHKKKMGGQKSKESKKGCLLVQTFPVTLSWAVRALWLFADRNMDVDKLSATQALTLSAWHDHKDPVYGVPSN